MSDPITVSVSIDAAALAKAMTPQPVLVAGLTQVEVFELIEQTSRYYTALEEIRRMVGTGADQVAARALGRNT